MIAAFWALLAWLLLGGVVIAIFAAISSAVDGWPYDR